MTKLNVLVVGGGMVSQEVIFSTVFQLRRAGKVDRVLISTAVLEAAMLSLANGNNAVTFDGDLCPRLARETPNSIPSAYSSAKPLP